MSEMTHFHCQYYKGKKFKLTAKGESRDDLDAMLLTEIELARYIKAMTGDTFKVGETEYAVTSVVMAKLREYLEWVIYNYQGVVDQGKKPDEQLQIELDKRS